MARDLRLNIEGDSTSGVKAIDKTADALDKANKELRAAEVRTDALAVKARKLAEAEERAADKTRDLAAKAAAMRKQIEESGDATGVLGKKLERLTRDTRSAALATDDYRRAADRASSEAREQARSYDKVAENAREAARAVATLGAVSTVTSGGKGGKGGGLGSALTEISGGFLKGGFGGGTAALEGLLGTPVVGPALLAIGAAASIPAGAFLGGAAGGGALAGIGAGAAGLGLAGAWMGDPEKYSIKWASSIDRIQKRWIDSSRAFGNELDGALKVAERTLQNLPVEKVLALSQSFVTPLAEGAGRGFTNFANGFADALEHVQPIIDRIGPELADLGTDFGDAIRAISLGSEGGADALGDLLNVVGYLVKATGIMILGFEKAYEAIRDFVINVHGVLISSPLFGPVILGLESILTRIASTATTTGRTLRSAGESGDSLGESWLGMAEAGAAAALASLELNDALTKTRNTQLGMANANIAVAQGWLDLQDELKEGAKTLKTNTQEGLDNQKAIIAQAQALEQQRQQAIALGKETPAAIAAANAAYDAGIQKIREMAHAAGFTDAQVDEMLRSYGLVPPVVSTQVNTPGLATALAQGISLGNALNNINGRTYYATVDVSYQGYNPGISLGNLLHHARGGEMPYSGFHVVGEHGPEARFDSRGAYTATAEETRKLTSMMGSGAGPGTAGPLTMKVVPGADSLFGQMVQYALDRGWVQIFAGSTQVTTRPG
jgi:hypothetical protein